MGSRDLGPAQGERKPEQPDGEIGLDLLSLPHGEDSEAALGLGLHVGGGEVLVTIQGLRFARRVPELPLDAGEAALEHPQLVGSVLALAHHQPHGNAPGLQPLTAGPGPELPWSAGGGPGLGPHQSVGDDQDQEHRSLGVDLDPEPPQ